MRCFICESAEFYLGPSTQSLTKEFTIYRCKNCRLVTTDPMPTDDDLDRFYGSNEAIEFSGFDIRQLIARHQEFINSPTDSVNLLKSSYLEVTRDLPPGAKCLEVGCNLGRLIELLQKNCRFDFHALELNEEAVRFCQDRAQFKIARARLQDNPFPGVVFDVIALFDVFEHLPRPEEFIGSMAARLRVGGFVMLAVPNAASLSANLLTLLKKLKGKGVFPAVCPPFHLNGFDKDNLDRLFARYGFKRLLWKTYPQCFPEGTYSPSGFKFTNLNNTIAHVVTSLGSLAKDDKLFITFQRMT